MYILGSFKFLDLKVRAICLYNIKLLGVSIL